MRGISKIAFQKLHLKNFNDCLSKVAFPKLRFYILRAVLRRVNCAAVVFPSFSLQSAVRWGEQTAVQYCMRCAAVVGRWAADGCNKCPCNYHDMLSCDPIQ